MGAEQCGKERPLFPVLFVWGNRQVVFGRLQSQKVPELNPPLTIWRDLLFRTRLLSFLGLLPRMWEPEPPVEQADYTPGEGHLGPATSGQSRAGVVLLHLCGFVSQDEKGKITKLVQPAGDGSNYGL